MTDQDTTYIRKAVELADGFQRRGHMVMVYGEIRMWLNNPGKMYLDALAAQLVRQVDATGKYTVTTYESTSTVLNTSPGHLWIEATGPDRTMNTIKAIVDSGVLSTGEDGE